MSVFDRSIAPPTNGSVLIAAGTTSARVRLPPSVGRMLRVTNVGAVPVCIEFGTGSVTAVVATADVAATGKLTSDGTNVSNGDTVTIGSITYTFKSTLGTVAYSVHVGSNATASLDNLDRCINASGGTAGTDYVLSTAHPYVSAARSGTVSTFTALIPGTAANSVALTTTAAHLTASGATLGTNTGTATIATTGSNNSGSTPVLNGTYADFVFANTVTAVAGIVESGTATANVYVTTI